MCADSAPDSWIADASKEGLAPRLVELLSMMRTGCNNLQYCTLRHDCAIILLEGAPQNVQQILAHDAFPALLTFFAFS